MKLSEMYKGMLLSEGYVTSVRRLRELAPEPAAGAEAPASARASRVDPGCADGPAGADAPSPRDACRAGPAIAGATR